MKTIGTYRTPIGRQSASAATYMTVMQLFEEYPAPFSPEMIIVIDHNTNTVY